MILISQILKGFFSTERLTTDGHVFLNLDHAKGWFYIPSSFHKGVPP